MVHSKGRASQGERLLLVNRKIGVIRHSGARGEEEEVEEVEEGEESRVRCTIIVCASRICPSVLVSATLTARERERQE